MIKSFIEINVAGLSHLVKIDCIKFIRPRNNKETLISIGEEYGNHLIADESYEEVCALIAAALTPPPSQP